MSIQECSEERQNTMYSFKLVENINETCLHANIIMYVFFIYILSVLSIYYRYITYIERHMLLTRLSVKSGKSKKKNSINKYLFSKNPFMLRHVSPYLFTYDCLATLRSWSYMPGPVSLTNEVN